MQWKEAQMEIKIENIKELLFKSMQEAEGETFMIDIGEYDKKINSAHEVESIFEFKLREYVILNKGVQK